MDGQVLVQKEWVAFGHKFASRAGLDRHGYASSDRSPVFLQWLDCVHQVLQREGALARGWGKKVDGRATCTPIQSHQPDDDRPHTQIQRQFPSAFEFTEELLLFLARYHHSGWFGDFLHDSERERWVRRVWFRFT